MTQLNVKITKKEQKSSTTFDSYSGAPCTPLRLHLGGCVDNTNKQYHCWLPSKNEPKQNTVQYRVKYGTNEQALLISLAALAAE